MKVYIVEEWFIHDGGQVVAIFSSKEAALKFVETKDPDFMNWKGKRQWYEVDEWYVDACTV